MKAKRKILIIVLLSILLVLVASLGGFFIYKLKHPLSLKEDVYKISLHQEYNYKDNIKSVFLGKEEEVTIQGKVNTDKLGEYEISYQYKDYSIPCLVQVVDTESPVLKVKDYKTDMVEVIKPKMFVTSCKDDSKVTYSIETKKTDKEGANEITIRATDAYGNYTEKTCTLTRIKDETAPSLDGLKDVVNAYQGTDMNYKNISISDDLDPEPTLTISGSVDFATVGVYKVLYTASDRSGNTTNKEVTYIVRKNSEEDMKVVYLTFDDGPSDNTAKVLKILKKYNVKATFFVTAHGTDYLDEMKKAHEEGHTIGLHSYTHQYNDIYSSVDAYFKDLYKLQDLVEKYTGEKSYVLRFPGGSSNYISASYSTGIMTKLVKLVHEKGFEYYDWNCDSLDASGNGVPASTIVEGATSGRGDKIMILMHDTFGKETTVKALPEIIEYYKNKGYVFKPITNGASYICHHGVTN